MLNFKNIAFLFILFAVSVLIISFQISGKSSSQKYLNDQTRYYYSSNSFNLSAGQLENVKKKLMSLTLREKIAQMVISNSLGENYDENSTEYKKLKKLCTVTKVGGFIFFKGTSAGYSGLSNKLQELSETPLLISADFERGTGMRVTDGTLFPNNMAIGATNNPDLAYKMGIIVAAETRALGIHQNYAPVCDVNNNPNNPIINVRSFGEDPELVSRMSEAMIRGLQEGKVIATSKHFPGHGDTEIDSHNDLPVLNFSMDRLNKIEIVPFKNAISKDVMSVMIAHLSFPELESKPNVPASLSENIVKGLLINQLGFKGLVVTDALNMKGITKYFSTSQVAVMCVNAGIDLILMPINEEETVSAIESAVSNGTINEERINQSVERILKAKEWLGLFENKYVNENEVSSKVNTSESNKLAQQIADESVTLVKDKNNILPLKSKNEKTIVFNLSDGNGNINSEYFSSKIKETNNNAEIIDIVSEISSGEFTELSAESTAYNVIIAAVYAKVRYGTGKISINHSHVELLNTLDKFGKKLIVISFGNPYLMDEFPNISNYICAYGDADVSINSAINAIYGDIKFKGRLPVSINDSFKFGSGISK
jgi:beta-N-acetylhexosaminidase